MNTLTMTHFFASIKSISRSALLALLLFSVVVPQSFAGKNKEWTEEDVMREIAYLAKKLLDMTGKESATVESPAFDKPFIGICTEITEDGVKITCVTPGTQAKKAGLETGDYITEMRGLNFKNKDTSVTKERYYEIVNTMKTDEKIKFVLNRGDEEIEMTVTVGYLSHPAYVLKVGG